MERFTKRRQDGRVGFAVNGTPSENMCKFPIVLDKLCEYEDLEEDERLIRLPCKIGDKVYNKNWNWSGTVEEISINSDGVFLYVTSGGYSHLVKQDEIEFE